MIRLLISECERLLSRKLIWLLYLAIPLSAFGALQYNLKRNHEVRITSPEYSSVYTFPVNALHEMLPLFVNLFLLVLIVLSVTEEYRGGELRLILIRLYSKAEVFFAKLGAILLLLLAGLLLFYLSSQIIGWLALSKVDAIYLFYHQEIFSVSEVFFYTIQFYLLAFVTLTVLSFVFLWIAIISPRVTVAMGLGIGYLLVSIIFDNIMGSIQAHVNSPDLLALFLMNLTITRVEYQGIHLMLAHPSMFMFFSLVLAVHLLLFGVLSFFHFARKDYCH